MSKQKFKKLGTMLTHSGTRAHDHSGVVNPPVYHASTIVFPSYAHLTGKKPVPYHYGRQGTDGDRYLCETISLLEGAHNTLLTPSGLMSITVVLLAFAKNNAHFLVSDNCYEPVRNFCEGTLKRIGVAVDYFDPMDVAAFADKFQKNTNFVWFESPGTKTFEVCDLTSLVSICQSHHVKCGIDNTWSAGVYLKPLAMGVDYSCQAGTKYIVGHSDALLGTIASKTAEDYEFVRKCWQELGSHTAPDDIYLAHRGLRTMEVRLRQHEQSALKVAHYLTKHAKVERVLHPALPSSIGHEFWRRDFSGSSGLFSFVLKDKYNDDKLADFLDNMRYFAMGYSWGGYESLVIPTSFTRTAKKWAHGGSMFRLNIGLEDVDDIIEDLDDGLKRLG